MSGVVWRFIAFLLVFIIVSKAQALTLQLECILEGVQTQRDGYQEQSEQAQHMFYITAYESAEPVILDSGGMLHNLAQRSLGNIRGDIGPWLENRIQRWWINESEYTFQTIADFEGRYHLVKLNRYSGQLIHAWGLGKGNDDINSGEYSNILVYQDCMSVDRQRRF